MKRGDRIQYTARFLRTVYGDGSGTGGLLAPPESTTRTGTFYALLPTHDGTFPTHAVIRWDGNPRAGFIHLSAIAPLGHSRLNEIDDMPDAIALGLLSTIDAIPKQTTLERRGPSFQPYICRIDGIQMTACHGCFLAMRRKALDVHPERWSDDDIKDGGANRKTRIERRFTETSTMAQTCQRCQPQNGKVRT
jgi:hypothetical protein